MPTYFKDENGQLFRVTDAVPVTHAELMEEQERLRLQFKEIGKILESDGQPAAAAPSNEVAQPAVPAPTAPVAPPQPPADQPIVPVAVTPPVQPLVQDVAPPSPHLPTLS